MFITLECVGRQMGGLIGKREKQIIGQLRGNARQNLTTISRLTNIPVSTIFEKIKRLEGNIILRHTSLLNFDILGYNLAHVLVRTRKGSKKEVESYLLRSETVNSLMRINNGFDFLVEAVFRNILELEEFLECLDDRFRIRKRQVFYVTNEVKREGYLADLAR